MNSIRTAALLLTAALGLASCNDPAPINNLPVANFTISPTTGAAPLAVSTTNTSSDADVGDVLSFDWSWGDGSANSTAKEPTHSYAASGNFSVTLTVKDSKGATSSKTTSVSVSPAAAAAPTVLSVSPASGSLGNPDTAVIVVTFSTAMDASATQAAFQSSSAGLTTGNVTFAWTVNNTVLTVKPNAALSYALAPAGPQEYAYTISTAARSAAGAALAKEYAASFKTLVNHVGQVFYSDPEKDTTVTGLQGAPFTQALGKTSADMVVGDNVANQAIGAYLSFDLSGLGSTVKPANITAAKLSLKASGAATGSPYTTLNTAATSTAPITPAKNLTVQGLFYGAVVDASELLPLGELAFNLDGTPATLSPDVTAKVQADWGARVVQTSLSQFQLRFATLTNNDGKDNQARIFSGLAANAANRPQLVITFLDEK